jgi:hypothetical protein
MTVIEKQATPPKIGINAITYSPGDFRESPGYNITFFKDDKKYYEYLKVESAEILMDLLGIDKNEVYTK